MPLYRHDLPQLSGSLFVTDGGMETTFIFLKGVSLPQFASVDLLRRPEGEKLLREYYRDYARVARESGVGVILDTPTWRASADWGIALGYGAGELKELNQRAAALLADLRSELQGPGTPVVIAGCVGPRGDGYVASTKMTREKARAYHREQVETFAQSEADFIAAATINYQEEAEGIVLAARDAGMPVAISFTVETDGKLPTGQTLGDAIQEVDASTGRYAAYFMINCAHPTHFEHALESGAGTAWLGRIKGVRANASAKSHAELNESTTLDAGDPKALARHYVGLKKRMPGMCIVGGCCGTDARHVGEMALACRGLFSR